jgi:hypothetical protein
MKSVKIALYLSIFLWFLRKLLAKLRGESRGFRRSIRRLPGQPGYDKEQDTLLQMYLGLWVYKDDTAIEPYCYTVGGPYTLCIRDAAMHYVNGLPRYTKHTNGLRMHFHFDVGSYALECDELLASVGWLSDEVKEFCDAGREYMDRVLGR